MFNKEINQNTGLVKFSGQTGQDSGQLLTIWDCSGFFGFIHFQSIHALWTDQIAV